MTAPRVVCCGEALIDLIPADDTDLWRAAAGGSPFNAAVAAGRLGAPTSFLGVLSDDRFGRMLAERLERSHVDHRGCPTTSEPTSLAIVSEASDGSAEPSFTFHVAGTTTTSTRVNDLHLPVDLGVLHVSGSVALVLEPAASRIENLLAAAQHRAIVHLDPNPRPALISRERYLRRLDRWLGLADVIKVSSADLEWISPRSDPIDVARNWLRGGGDPDLTEELPSAVVVTRGPDGAAVVLSSGVVEVPATTIEAVDTVGAGDAFSGAMLAAFASHEITTPGELRRLDHHWWRTALTYAVEAAGIACSRVGADPPWRRELHRLRD